MADKAAEDGRSGLDDYLKTAHGNAQKVLQRGGVWLSLLREVDAAYVAGEESVKPTPGTVVGGFVVASHSAWLAAVNLGLCMHWADSFQPLRAALESAFYGYHVHVDGASWDRWAKRPTMARIEANPSQATSLQKERKKIGREFSVTAIASTFPSQLEPLRSRALRLYDELIDFGAHFNFPVLSRGFRKTGKTEDYYSVEVRILLAREHEQAFGFTKLVEVGITSLEVFDAGIAHTWDSSRIKSMVAGLKTRLEKRPKDRLARRGAT